MPARITPRAEYRVERLLDTYGNESAVITRARQSGWADRFGLPSYLTAKDRVALIEERISAAIAAEVRPDLAGGDWQG